MSAETTLNKQQKRQQKLAAEQKAKRETYLRRQQLQADRKQLAEINDEPRPKWTPGPIVKDHPRAKTKKQKADENEKAG